MAAPLQISIVGAGIGGLCAAIGLRQQGHNVKIYERSHLAKEIGAALHIAPNCNGLLHRIGIDPRDHGSVEMLGMALFNADGSTISCQDMREANKAWQHPWDLIHRAHLHSALLKKALSEDGPGRMVELHSASPVQSVDPSTATVHFENGAHQADLVIGADGVHSNTRKAIHDLRPYDSGKSAYRFLLRREELAKHKGFESLLELHDYFYMWAGEDRRVVVYPCDGGASMNVAAIFPSEELSAEGEGWAKKGSTENLLEIYQDFEDRVKTLLGLAQDPQAWTLLDMEQMPTFVKDKLVLIGDAAHPFLPHQAQGGAQAIEDGMSLAALLPLGTAPEDIPSRLELYSQQRFERSHKIQQFTRDTGEDYTDEPPDFAKFVPYNVGHDEWHASTAALQNHLASTSTERWYKPAMFGAIPELKREVQSQIVVRFKSSRTYLQTLLPADCSFTSPATVCEASWVCTTFKPFWPGEEASHSSFSLCVHGVQCKESKGTFVALTFEDSVDSILGSKEAKQFCFITVEETAVKLSWHDVEFAQLELHGASGEDGSSNGDCSFFAWDREETSSIEIAALASSTNSTVHTFRHVNATFTTPGPARLPTLHGISKVLADLPNYGLVTARRSSSM